MSSSLVPSISAGRFPSQTVSKKKSKKKSQIVFDEAKRHDWLSGFRKRKQERRAKALEQQQSELKKLKLEAKRKVAEKWSQREQQQQTLPPGMEVGEQDCLEMQNHVVHIQHLEQKHEELKAAVGSRPILSKKEKQTLNLQVQKRIKKASKAKIGNNDKKKSKGKKKSGSSSKKKKSQGQKRKG